MSPIEVILVTLGLVLFEVVSSADNAVINAQIIQTMSARGRRWFLSWGIFISVFLVRGLLPLVIVWLASPKLGLVGAFTASFSSDPRVATAVAVAKPILLAGGGLYLILLFLNWLLLETKNYAFAFERKVYERYGFWFYALASIMLVGVTSATIKTSPLIALGAVIGSSTYFITAGFKTNAEAKEHELVHGRSASSDISKLLYLEVIDATFSIDGVLGAFAFTTAVPLILIGNGIGAVIVRQLTLKGMNRMNRLPYLSNGAMYSILMLGCIMLTESLGHNVPFWITPLATLIIVGYFAIRSWRDMGSNESSIV